VLIVRTDRELEVPRVDAALRAEGHTLVLLPDGVSEDALAAAVAEADLLLMCYTPITARVIAAAPRLKGIVKYGVGIDAIDIEAAKARAIPVVNVPEYAEETVAEGAMTLMLALAKRLKPIQRAMDSQGWAWPTEAWMGHDLSGKTLGLVGLGKIGTNVARMAGAGFRMRVLAYDPNADAARFEKAGATRCAPVGRGTASGCAQATWAATRRRRSSPRGGRPVPRVSGPRPAGAARSPAARAAWSRTGAGAAPPAPGGGSRC